jgi:hypothetical protein
LRPITWEASSFFSERRIEHSVVLPKPLAPVIPKAGGESIHHADRPIAHAQKQSTGVRRHQPGIEGCVHSPPFNDSKIKPFCATLCLRRGFLRIIEKSFSQNNFR